MASKIACEVRLVYCVVLPGVVGCKLYCCGVVELAVAGGHNVQCVVIEGLLARCSSPELLDIGGERRASSNIRGFEHSSRLVGELR